VNAEQWNARYPVGTPVFAYPGARPEVVRKTRRLVTRTRSAATLLSGHTDVVWVEDYSSCIALDHVDVVSESVFEAAKAADSMAAATAKAAATDTLSAWLYQRFNRLAKPWDALSEDDKSYWEHEARAVRRAVERGGFRTAPAGGAR
jgi:hypothetical protein